MEDRIAEINSFLAVLEPAYYSGAKIVKHGDKTTEFDNRTEMKKLIQALKKERAGLKNSSKNFLGGKVHTPALRDY